MLTPEELEYLREQEQPQSKRRVVGLFAVLVLLITGVLLLKSSYFIVGTVVVEGNRYVTDEDVYLIADIPQPVNILSLSTDTIRQRLQKDLRIADAQVERHFPGSIVIRITERKPVAYVASNYGFVELDQQGMVLAVFKNLKQLTVPVVTGIRLENQYVGDKTNQEMLLAVLDYLAMLDERALSQISEINIKPSGQMVAYTVNSLYIRLGDTDRLADKAKLTSDVLQEIANKRMAIEYVDLTYAAPFIKIKY